MHTPDFIVCQGEYGATKWQRLLRVVEHVSLLIIMLIMATSHHASRTVDLFGNGYGAGKMFMNCNKPKINE